MAETVMGDGSGVVAWERQWRLSRVEIANWGTLDGLVGFDVSPDGLHISGESGSGKSTILDAIATVITPSRYRTYNSAAKGQGGRARDRTLVDYIRGACGTNEEAGEVSKRYLRATRATWSGILLTYRSFELMTVDGQPTGELREAGDVEPLELCSLMFLRAGSNDGADVKHLYSVLRGTHSLIDFQPYVTSGLDRAAFAKAYPEAKVFSRHGELITCLRRRFSIAQERTLGLLHKVQGAKRFGSLDELFRHFMLDKPETFALADAAVAVYSDLSAAYENVTVAKEQKAVLDGLVENYAKERRESADYSALSEESAAIRVAAITFAMESLERELAELANKRDGAEAAVEAAERVLAERRRVEQVAARAVDDKGGLALANAERDLRDARAGLASVEARRACLLHDLSAVGFGEVSEVPGTFEAWRALVERLKRTRESAREREVECKRILEDAQGRLSSLKVEMAEVDAELEHLAGRRSNIPRAHDAVRSRILAAIGGSVEEFPFVGEIVEVDEAYAEWRGAIERVFGAESLTLLVPDERRREVDEFVNSTHLGIRLGYVPVRPVQREVADFLDERQVGARVNVRDVPGHPEYALWVKGRLAGKWNFTCVESVEDLDRFDKALTVKGLSKTKGSRIKNDSHRVDDASRWCLGWRNDAKMAVLAARHEALAKDIAEVGRKVSEAEVAREALFSVVHAAGLLDGRRWADYDVRAARDAVDLAERTLARLREESRGLVEAVRQRDEAAREAARADRVLRDVRVTLETTRSAIAERERTLAGYGSLLSNAESLSEELLSRVRERFLAEDGDFARSYQDIDRVSGIVQGSLRAQMDELSQSITRHRISVARRMGEWQRRWPTVIPDVGTDYDEVEEYVAIHRDISAKALPDFQRRFLELFNEFSTDAVVKLRRAVVGARREVERRLVPVNRSLRLSPFEGDRYLEIEVRPMRLAVVEGFKRSLNEIVEGSLGGLSMEEAERRFLKLSALLARLGSTSEEDRAWQRMCLDTRRHVTFIAHEVDAEGNRDPKGRAYTSDAGLSGGQKQKLVIFCLAAALRYQLADEGRFLPTYGTLIFDEALDKADARYTESALAVLHQFGFHLVLATPGGNHAAVFGRYTGSGLAVAFDEAKGRTRVSSAVYKRLDEAAGEVSREAA